MKPVILLFTLVTLVTACTPAAATPTYQATLPPDTVETSPPTTEPGTSVTPAAPSYEPKPGDINLERGTLSIGETAILLRESFPVQVVLGLGGELPTPCHQLRVIVNPPDVENKIHLEAYTVVNPEMICVQVTKPFQEMIELGSFPGGHYTVWVNETLIGEFDS